VGRRDVSGGRSWASESCGRACGVPTADRRHRPRRAARVIVRLDWTGTGGVGDQKYSASSQLARVALAQLEHYALCTMHTVVGSECMRRHYTRGAHRRPRSCLLQSQLAASDDPPRPLAFGHGRGRQQTDTACGTRQHEDESNKQRTTRHKGRGNVKDKQSQSRAVIARCAAKRQPSAQKGARLEAAPRNPLGDPGGNPTHSRGYGALWRPPSAVDTHHIFLFFK
jgi:hypothetical protein